MLKIMNVKAQFMVGMACNVKITVKSWYMKTNVLVVHLEDFDLILGVDSCQKAKLMPMPHLDGIMIM